MFTIEPGNVADLQARLQAVREQLAARLPETVAAFGTEVALPQFQAATPTRTGGLAAAYQTSVSHDATGTATLTITNSQGQRLQWLIEGTGIYGPRGQRITPTVARALMWDGASHPFRSVKGIQGRDFLTPVQQALAAEVGPALSQFLTTCFAAL